MKIVTTLFHLTGDVGATRMGSESRAGAIGFFAHPGALALYSTISSVFFLFYILNKQNVKKSNFIFLLNLVTIVLTFSRTTYLVYILVIFLSYYILKNPKKSIFSLKNVLRLFLPLGLLFLWIIVFSPLSDIFLESDVNQQFDNRALHWLMAIEAFKQAPIFGVGLNTHLIYFSKHPTILKNLELSPFFLENPIHNIHLILLVELGLVGFIMWIIFLGRSVANSKFDISKGQNTALSITQIGTVIVYIFYGLTGWAPFSLNILPYFLFIMYFAEKYRGVH
ncbi:O-antigen ligase family protein [Dyadobacter diqingensis]|uniref:O-antigen ligase family protein n=1 Tax=Dyadobacter diqingensis TaxID=2938121 RepID=UPI0020C18B43|nr:O-antigen ligase family protein [Dyadobacter diqingensis]